MMAQAVVAEAMRPRSFVVMMILLVLND